MKDRSEVSVTGFLQLTYFVGCKQNSLRKLFMDLQVIVARIPGLYLRFNGQS